MLYRQSLIILNILPALKSKESANISVLDSISLGFYPYS